MTLVIYYILHTSVYMQCNGQLEPDIVDGESCKIMKCSVIRPTVTYAHKNSFALYVLPLSTGQAVSVQFLRFLGRSNRQLWLHIIPDKHTRGQSRLSYKHANDGVRNVVTPHLAPAHRS